MGDCGTSAAAGGDSGCGAVGSPDTRGVLDAGAADPVRCVLPPESGGTMLLPDTGASGPDAYWEGAGSECCDSTPVALRCACASSFVSRLMQSAQQEPDSTRGTALEVRKLRQCSHSNADTEQAPHYRAAATSSSIMLSAGMPIQKLASNSEEGGQPNNPCLATESGLAAVIWPLRERRLECP